LTKAGSVHGQKRLSTEKEKHPAGLFWAALLSFLCWDGIFQSSCFKVCACEIPIKQWGNMHHDCSCLQMFDMDCDNLVNFLPCEGGVLLGVVFPEK
jgi:hypothetical protein